MKQIAFALPLILAACAGGPPPRGGGFGPVGGRLFISPMGEPFRTDGAAAWFAGADRDHDGRLTRAEFEADADRFFQTLDVNRDGEIDPAEIDRYETEVAPEIRVGGSEGPDGGEGGGHGRGRGRGGPPAGGGPGGGDGPPDGPGGSAGSGGGGPTVQGAGRYGYLGLPEPVTAADTNMDRGVSPTEFHAAADSRFTLLDRNGDGLIEQGELPARGGAPRPPHGRGDGRGRAGPPPEQPSFQ